MVQAPPIKLMVMKQQPNNIYVDCFDVRDIVLPNYRWDCAHCSQIWALVTDAEWKQYFLPDRWKGVASLSDSSRHTRRARQNNIKLLNFRSPSIQFNVTRPSPEHRLSCKLNELIHKQPYLIVILNIKRISFRLWSVHALGVNRAWMA